MFIFRYRGLGKNCPKDDATVNGQKIAVIVLIMNHGDVSQQFLRDSIRNEINGSADMQKQIRSNGDSIAGVNVRLRNVSF